MSYAGTAGKGTNEDFMRGLVASNNAMLRGNVTDADDNAWGTGVDLLETKKASESPFSIPGLDSLLNGLPSMKGLGNMFTKDGVFGSTGPVMQGLGTLESGFKFYDTFFGDGKDYRKAQAQLAGKQNQLADQVLAENERKAADAAKFASYFNNAPKTA